MNINKATKRNKTQLTDQPKQASPGYLCIVSWGGGSERLDEK